MLLHVVPMSSRRWQGDNPSLFSLRDGTRETGRFNLSPRRKDVSEDARSPRSSAARQR